MRALDFVVAKQKQQFAKGKVMKNSWILVYLVGMLFFTNVIVVLVLGQENCANDSSPDDISCPAPGPQDCDEDQAKYELYWDEGYHINPWFEVYEYVSGYFIRETSATCGGQKSKTETGAFGTMRNDGNYAFMEGTEDCYTRHNCNWAEDGVLDGYVWEHYSGLFGEYDSVEDGQVPQYKCTVNSKACGGPFPNFLWHSGGLGCCGG